VTQHLHGEIVPGCFRCDLGRDEAEAAEQEAAEQAEREANCPGHNWRERTTRFDSWAECIQCGAEEER
jgi:hypothetical protein